jgi:hypothetical protein
MNPTTDEDKEWAARQAYRETYGMSEKIIEACLCEDVDGVSPYYQPHSSVSPWDLDRTRVKRLVAKLTPETARELEDRTIALVRELTVIGGA